MALVMPASAADFKFGGYYDTKFYSTDNLANGDDDIDDNTNWFKTRARLYFTATASENLKFVSKFEVDDTWGSSNMGTMSADGGSSNQTTGLEIKNVYINFRIPDTPLTFDVGAFGITLDKAAYVFSDDTSGIAAYYQADPIKVFLLYSRLGDGDDGVTFTPTDADKDIDLWAATFKFKQEMFEVGVNGAWVNTESRDALTTPDPHDDDEDVDLYVFSVDADLSMDMFSAYATALFNAGQDDGAADGDGADFKGWLFVAGGSVNLDTFKVGLDFIYATGDDDPDDGDIDVPVALNGGTGRSTYTMDAVIMGGWFDDDTAKDRTGLPGKTNNVGTIGGGSLGVAGGSTTGASNIIGIGARASMQPMEKTFVEAGLAWFKPEEDVLIDGDMDDDPYGTSLFVRASQGIVDGLTLKGEFGYLFADDGYSPTSDDDAYKLGLGLFWSW
jgi:hypothetical protein